MAPRAVPPRVGLPVIPGQSADMLANPGIAGVEPLPVFTIGFSEAVADAPPQLTCISDKTDGLYYGARNASELTDALYEVFYALQTDARSFIPFKVSPPPSTSGGPANVQDSLAVYPILQAAPKKTLWFGNLYGFKFNRDQTTLPSTGNCSVDLSQVVVEEVSGNTWDANARLAEQLAAHNESSPARYVFMGSDATTSWARHDLATIPANPTLRAEFESLLNVSAGITSLETQEIVNFVRGVWMDDDGSASPDPDPSPRPAGSSALGDIYHSQPVVLSPPNSSIYYFDYGLGVSGRGGGPRLPVLHEKTRQTTPGGSGGRQRWNAARFRRRHLGP